MKKGFLVLGLTALLGLGAWGAGAQLRQPPPERPDALMNAVTLEVITVLKQDLAAGRPTDVAQLVEGKILPLFDFARMTQIALARNWRLASPEQQAALVTQFRTLLVRTYSSALSEYRDQELGMEPLTIDYDMENSVAGWKVVDLKIAGISLVMNYRETFAAEVRSGGIDGLIKTLSDKNQQNDG